MSDEQRTFRRRGARRGGAFRSSLPGEEDVSWTRRGARRGARRAEKGQYTCGYVLIARFALSATRFVSGDPPGPTPGAGVDPRVGGVALRCVPPRTGQAAGGGAKKGQYLCGPFLLIYPLEKPKLQTSD